MICKVCNLDLISYSLPYTSKIKIVTVLMVSTSWQSRFVENNNFSGQIPDKLSNTSGLDFRCFLTFIATCKYVINTCLKLTLNLTNKAKYSKCLFLLSCKILCTCNV